MRRCSSAALILCLTILFGCSSGEGEPSLDAGESLDASGAVDSGPDASSGDAGASTDAALPDAGSDDAGEQDAGTLDPDGGGPDAGEADAGESDAGTIEPWEVTVWDLKNPEAPNRPAADVPVLVREAIVTAVGFADGPGRQAVFVSDPEGGAWRGIELRGPSELALGALALGSRVEIEGVVREVEGRRHVELGDVALTATGEPLAPEAISSPAALPAEAYDGVFVALSGVEVTRDDLGGNAFEVAGALRVDDRIWAYGAPPAVGTHFLTLRGVLSIEAGVLSLLPRMAADMVSSCSPGATGCSGRDVTTCGEDGLWTVTETCEGGCVAGACTACMPGQRGCDGADARLCSAAGAWAVDETCAAACIEGACVECAPGARDCSGLEARLCAATGEWRVAESCAAACIDGACADCAPGASGCDGRDRMTCDANGQWQVAETCAGGCVGGACTACQPGERGCDGLDATLCSAAGGWTVAETCATACTAGVCAACATGERRCNGMYAELCTAQGVWEWADDCYQVCIDGYCFMCVPEANSCAGRWLQHCLPDGTFSSETELCPGDCVDGACVPCASGTMGCADPVVRARCDGGSWTSLETCPVACVAGACAECEPEQWGCDGQVVRSCDAAGHWQTEQTCVEPQTCMGGQCVIAECTPGERRCRTDAGGTFVDECGLFGQWAEMNACTASQTCVGGWCEGSECTGFESACQGQDWMLCDGHGTFFTVMTCAGTAESWCNAAAGGCVCQPGTRRCNGALAVEECNADGYFSNVEYCSGGEACVDGVCSSGQTEPVFTVGGLMWHQPNLVSGLPPSRTWNDAVAYCSGLTWAGFTDWRLPTISELRLLVHGCANTQAGGACGITAGCAELSCDGTACNGCTGNAGPCSGRYLDPAKVRTCTATSLWSNTSQTDDSTAAWTLGAATAEIGRIAKTSRWESWCVR